MKALAILAAACPANAAAQAPDAFCADLEQILEAAAEPNPFVSLGSGRAAAPTLGFEHCYRGRGSGGRLLWLCHQSLAPEELSAERLAERTRACLPRAESLPVRSWSPRYRFRIATAEIEITETGGPRAHVGRIVSYSVVAARPAAGGEAERKFH